MGTYSGQAVFGGTTDPITGSWTSATSLNSTINSTDITGYGVVEASFSISGTITAGTIVFEVSDDGGTTWWPMSGLQSGSNAQLTSYALANGSAAFQFATGAFNMFRLRLNPAITGSGSVALRIQAEAFPYITAVAVSGSITASSASVGLTGQAVPTSADFIGASDGTNLRGLLVDGSGNLKVAQQGTVTVSGTVAVTQSTSPWVTNVSQFGGSNVVTGTGAGGAGIPRVTVSNDSVISSITNIVAVSGTVTATQGTTPWTIQGDSASGAAKAGNPVQVGGVFNTTQPTVTSGQTVEAQSTAHGALIVATGTDAFAVNATQAGTWTVQQGTPPWSQNITQIASTNLGIPQTFGTAPTGVVIGTSSDMYISGTRARSNQTTTAAGVQDVNIVGSLGVTNSVTNGTFIAITDNTTKVGVVAGSAALKTDISSVAGTATVVAAAGVQKVGIVGNAGAVVDFVGQAVSSPANSLQVGGQFNTTPTTLASGQSSPLQLDQNANLKVNLSTIQPSSGGTTSRTYLTFVLDNLLEPTTEALQTMAINKNGIVTSAASYTVTSGKVLRVQTMSFGHLNNTGASKAQAHLRAVNSGSVAATSPILMALACGLNTGGSSMGNNAEQSIPDGIELPAGAQLGISLINLSGGNGSATVTVVGYEY